MLSEGNLYDLAAQESVTIYASGKLNKGWVGQTIERLAGLNVNNRQGRDGLDFELKTTSVVSDGSGWIPKETIKITQLSPKDMLEETFESSSLWEKLSRIVFVTCHHESKISCRVIHVCGFDLDTPEIVSEIRVFWNEIQGIIFAGEIADVLYPGSARGYLQLRPTGTGRQLSPCPITGRRFPTMAFYATKRLVKHILEREHSV